MNRAKIEACEKLCREFLERANAVRTTSQPICWSDGSYIGSKETGALRRISMELTRALADLRKSK